MNNRQCKLCNEKYYYCPSCEGAYAGKKGYETWHVLVHDQNCYDIFCILQKHFLKEYSDTQAAELLKACDLSVLETASPAVKEQAEAILSSVKPQKKTKASTSDEN